MRAWARLLAAAGMVSASLAVAAAPRSVEGKAARVGDGDSLWLAPAGGGAQIELRLQDIDAPEICQPWGPEARDALQEKLAGKLVRAELGAQDTHGRTLATLYVEDVNVNQWLVKEGHAWSDRYKHDRGRYVAEERMAKALGRGFNAAGNAVPPRDFRRDHGPCAGTGTALAPTAPAPAPAPSAQPAQPAGATVAQAATGAPAFKCDGRVYCSQMRSCAEATFFLKSCPGVKMDGDGDGVPCETQWCRR